MIDLTKHGCHSCPSLKLAESRGCTLRKAQEYREQYAANQREAAEKAKPQLTEVQRIAAQLKAADAIAREQAQAKQEAERKAARAAQIRAAAILGSKKAAANRAARKAAAQANVSKVIQETEEAAARRRQEAEHADILASLVAQNMLSDLMPKTAPAPVISVGLDDILAHTLATTPEVAELVTLQTIPAAARA